MRWPRASSAWSRSAVPLRCCCCCWARGFRWSGACRASSSRCRRGRLQSIAPQLGELRARPAGGAGESLVVLVDRVAHETGIARSLNTQAGSDGTLSVRLDQVAFDALLNWAGELVQRHGVRVVSASIDSGANSGMVSATIVLRAS